MNILEVLPKDKKAKEEKTAVLGQASLDLLPTLLGEAHSSSLTLTLHTVTEGGGAPPSESNEPVSMTYIIHSIGGMFKYYTMVFMLVRLLRLILKYL